MDLPINSNPPQIMHIDLNSCFATVEQQANPLLRHRPVVVAAYRSPHGCVIAPSIEAKRLGITVGMTVREATRRAQNLIVLEPDPPKYHDVHLRLRRLFSVYSPCVQPKSIDEAILDFNGVKTTKSLVEIGQEIKRRIRREIGEWICCNVGIATNRFLAKLAASLNKPDGLDVITHQNLKAVYQTVSLTNLHGINTRYQTRLNAHRIFTPLDFLNTNLFTLRAIVFKSIVGYYWYLRLRGWEIDTVDFTRKSIGQSYALSRKTARPSELARLMLKLCEKMGRRLRRSGMTARGIHVSCLYQDGTVWHRRRQVNPPMYATQELYSKAMWLLKQQPCWKTVSHLAVSCFNFSKLPLQQETLFETPTSRYQKLARATDVINDRWGEYVITPALMLGMDDLIINRIAFGSASPLNGPTSTSVT